ncbi:MAG: anti-sigma factor domain-containing protein [Anaerolineae bacterium]
MDRSECTAIHELIPAYSIGATDLEETRLIEAHLASCQEAAAELADYAELAETMLYSAPPLEAPASLADSLRAALEPATKSTAGPLPALPAAAPVVRHQSWWQRFRHSLTGSGALSWQPLAALAMLAIVLLAAVSLYWGTQVRDLRREHQTLAATLQGQSRLLAMVSEDQAVRVSIPAGPAGEQSDAYASMVCNFDTPIGFLLAEHLPELSQDQAYQVWLLQQGTATSAGYLDLDGQGNGELLINAPLPMGQYDSLAITAEPHGGSPEPSGPSVIEGSIYGGDY